MRKRPALSPVLTTTLMVIAVLATSSAWCEEVQLAGIRLGQHSLKVLQSYGQPKCIIAAGRSAVFVPEAPTIGDSGTIVTPQNDMVRLPDWDSVTSVPMTSKETMWCYQRGGVVLGVVLDRDGYVVGLAVAGEKCDWARTALGEPLRTVKLGDSMQRVIDRYGYPQTTSVTPGTAFSRDVTLHFGYGQNVDFTCRNMKVTRIYIWEVQLRGTSAVRLPSQVQASPEAFPSPLSEPAQ